MLEEDRTFSEDYIILRYSSLYGESSPFILSLSRDLFV